MGADRGVVHYSNFHDRIGGPLIALGASRCGTSRKYSRCGTVDLENVPPVGQMRCKDFAPNGGGGSGMICLFCGEKIRWWQNKVRSVITANHYHSTCLWDAGRSNHQKRKGNDQALSPSRPRRSPELTAPTISAGKGSRVLSTGTPQSPQHRVI